MRQPQYPEGLRTEARQHRERDGESGTTMLELAAALCEAAGSPPATPWFRNLGGPRDTPAVDVLAGAFAAWAEGCAAVLAAMTRALAGAEASWKGGGVPVSGDSLPAVAERLATGTRSLNEALARTATVLRSEAAELVRRASDVGSLERSVQHERGRLREAAERCKALEEQLATLGGERSRAADRVAMLQERLRLAGAKTAERRAMEQRVAEAEAAAGRDRAEGEEMEKRLQILEQERSGLGERLLRTRALIDELEKSPDRELSQRVHEIWRCLPPDAAPRGARSE